MSVILRALLHKYVIIGGVVSGHPVVPKKSKRKGLNDLNDKMMLL
jgi:hypothetical protein